MKKLSNPGLKLCCSTYDGPGVVERAVVGLVVLCSKHACMWHQHHGGKQSENTLALPRTARVAKMRSERKSLWLELPSWAHTQLLMFTANI
jgi:hypothetical protein